MVHIFNGCGQLSEIISLTGSGYLFPGSIGIVGVVVLVDIDNGVGAKIYRIGTRAPCAVIFVGVKNLSRKRFPAAGGTAIHETGPALADASKLFLNERHQLVSNGIAIWTKVG